MALLKRIKSGLAARKKKKDLAYQEKHGVSRSYKGQGPTAKEARKTIKVGKKGATALTQKGRRKQIGASKGTKVSRGATGVEKTKGGEYTKYKKDSKAAGSFRKAFKANCSGGKGGTFSWQGRSYSCGKASAKKKPAAKKGSNPGSLSFPGALANRPKK